MSSLTSQKLHKVVSIFTMFQDKSQRPVQFGVHSGAVGHRPAIFDLLWHHRFQFGVRHVSDQFIAAYSHDSAGEI